MKTKSLLSVALPMTLAAFALACGSSPSSSSTDESEQNPTVEPDDTTKAPASPPAAAAPPETPAPAPATAPPVAAPAIPTAKIHAAPVWHYAVANDAIWVATANAVERTAADGTMPTPIPALAEATALTTDGTRVYALLDKGWSAEVFSTKSDGTDGLHHLSWSYNYGDPGVIAVNGGRIFFSASNPSRPDQSMLVSIASGPPAGGNAQWRVEEYLEAQNLAPAFATDRLFAVDYYRQSAVRVSTVDTSESVDVIQQAMPRTAAGIATDGKDVFTRTAKGIVKVAIGSGANSEPIVVVPSGTCSIFDPADGSESLLDDALVVDGTSIYTACRAGTNVEVRAYATDGKLVKTVATVPYTGGLTHLRVTSTAAYWLARTSIVSMDSELWRAAK
jgi:hypothetical protein